MILSKLKDKQKTAKLLVSLFGHAQHFLTFTENIFQFCETMLFGKPLIHGAAYAKENDL